MPKKAPEIKWGIGSILIFFVAPAILGIILSAFIPQPIIGMIELRDPLDNNSGRALTDQIQYAYNNKRIKAVVMI